MTDLFMRKFGCDCCKDIVVIDLDAGTQTCGCGAYRIPQWMMVDAYNRKRMLKDYRPTTQQEVERLKRQAGA